MGIAVDAMEGSSPMRQCIGRGARCQESWSRWEQLSWSWVDDGDCRLRFGGKCLAGDRDCVRREAGARLEERTC